MSSPTPEIIRTTRLKFKLTQRIAAEVVYKSLRSWQRYESGQMQMAEATWELFLIRGQDFKKEF